MLTVGDTFPSFALKAVKGGPAGLKLDTAFTDITTQTDAGKWKIVFFWPKDFTFVCPTEIVAFGKLAGDFADRDAAEPADLDAG
jgi:peroxiredoxin (alkyl hydroperoxide reductase subunit C)